MQLGKTLIDLQQACCDPRLPSYATLWPGNINSQQAAQLPITTNPARQKRLPNGYYATLIKTVIPGFTNDQLAVYSEQNTGTIANFSSPVEAALSDWGPGTGSDHYGATITAAMQSTIIIPPAASSSRSRPLLPMQKKQRIVPHRWL